MAGDQRRLRLRDVHDLHEPRVARTGRRGTPRRGPSVLPRPAARLASPFSAAMSAWRSIWPDQSTPRNMSMSWARLARPARTAGPCSRAGDAVDLGLHPAPGVGDLVQPRQEPPTGRWLSHDLVRAHQAGQRAFVSRRRSLSVAGNSWRRAPSAADACARLITSLGRHGQTCAMTTGR